MHQPRRAGQASGFIPAIALWQPWASLIVIGAKTVETRGPTWNFKHRGDLVIHAARTTIGMQSALLPLFRAALTAAGLNPYSLPLGAALGLVELYDVVPAPGLKAKLSPQEQAFGNYEREDGKDRKALLLRNIRLFPEPVKYTGSQGLFGFPRSLIPPDLITIKPMYPSKI
jgi:hypothetical protein